MEKSSATDHKCRDVYIRLVRDTATEQHCADKVFEEFAAQYDVPRRDYIDHSPKYTRSTMYILYKYIYIYRER